MDRPARCVLCHARPVDPKWRPFCSRRCQVADQAKWATDAYRVSGPPADVLDENEDDNQDDG
jgi:uncharacterized protein